ncbi:MAG TPA: hypothetical protein VFU13_20075 [Steroidobacteraceae bacterium]|nr:hypothetical protein [Steroidobacteraceae bacterium]
MGSLSKLINDIDGASQDEKQQKERLEILLTLAKSKIDKFRTELDAGFANPGLINKTQVPGTRAIRYIEQYHVASKSEFDQQVGDHLTHAIDAFFSIGEGNNKKAVQDGLKQVIQTGLSGFIGSTSVGESQDRMYFVVPENNAFVRIDVVTWKYHFDQQKILDQHDTAVAYVLCKSVIDHTQVTLDELIYLVTQALSSGEYLNENVKPGGLEPPTWTTDKNDAIRTKLQTLGLDPITRDKAVFDFLTNAISESPGVVIKKALPTTGTDSRTMTWSAFATRVAARDVPYIEAVPAAPAPADGKKPAGSYLRFRSQLDIATVPTRTSPASLSVVEGYIDEMVRVWKKLQADR